jgi:hypothetical protein
MATITLRSDITTNNDLLKEGGLRKLFDNTAGAVTQYYKPLVNETSGSDYEFRDAKIAGLGLSSEIVDGQNIPLDTPLVGGTKTYTQRRFGNGFRMTRMMDKFNKYNLFQKWTKSLARMQKVSKDVEVHVMFNNPTSASLTCGTGFDGLAIAHDTHYGLGSSLGQTYDNYLNAALSYTSLESARYYFKTLKDDRGQLLGGNPTKLVIEPTLWPTAQEILKSGDKAHEMSNTKNAFENYLTIYEDPMLTSTTAWFIIDKGEGYDFNVITTEEPDMIIKDAPDNTRDRVAISEQMFTYGWGDARKVYWGRG